MLRGVLRVRRHAVGDAQCQARQHVPRAVRPILTATVLMSCVPLSGVFVVVFFAGDILGSIFPSHRNLAAVLVPFMGVIGVAFASCGADRVGRRPLLLLSAVGMALSMVVLGLYFHCHVP